MAHDAHELLGMSLPMPSLGGPAARGNVSLPVGSTTPGLLREAQHLVQLQFAATAACAEVQALTQAQLMKLVQDARLAAGNQIMDDVRQVEALARQQDAVPAGQSRWAPGMTLRLAANGMPPGVAPAEAAASTAPPAAQQPQGWGTALAPAQLGSLAQTPEALAARAARRKPPHVRANRESSKPGETLRTHLQELRQRDPRCVFVTRRINKLGFRSKQLLIGHFKQYGEVVQVLVAHSKVKPLPNSGTMPRTRPGNFGLVVMKSPDAAQHVLSLGTHQAVAGVPIEVQAFEQQRLEKEFQAQEDLDSGSSGSNEPCVECFQDDDFFKQTSSEWTNQTSSPPDSVVGGGACGSGESTTMDASEWGYWLRSVSSCGGPSASREQLPQYPPHRHVEHHHHPAVAPMPPYHVGFDTLGAPPPRHRFEGGLQLDPEDIEHLSAWAKSYTASLVGGGAAAAASMPAPPISAPPAPRDMGAAPATESFPHSSSFAAVLRNLSHIAKDSDRISSFTPEESLQAAALAQWAQQSLRRLEEECQQMIVELARVQPAPGLTRSAAPAPRAPAESRLPQPPPQPQPPVSALHAAAVAAASAAESSPVHWLTLLAAAQDRFGQETGAAFGGSADGHSVAPSMLSGNSANHARGAGNLPADFTSGAAAPRSGAGAGPNNLPVPAGSASDESMKKRRSRTSCADSRSDTLRSHLNELSSEDPCRIFIARKINKLGFRSRGILVRHFSQYGEVSRVLVAHSKVKPFHDAAGQLRTRPGSLGLIVMRKATAVKKILALGEEQMVAGYEIRIQCFERPKVDETRFAGSETSTTVGKSQGSGSSGSDGSGSRSANKSSGGSSDISGSQSQGKSEEGGSSNASNDKSEEGGSSNDSYDKSDPDAGSSGTESQDGGAESPEGGRSHDARSAQ
mmetsp:Transcript_17592/g.50010  ORF Transcript_17592/g.50010 Transcript_17592/m.50010 type:complete len:911 (-) Transcript_17592:367-3099(-)